MSLPAHGYAFFDLDRTLLADDSMLLFCSYILKKERWRMLYLLVVFPAVILFCFRIIGKLGLKRAFFSHLYRMRANQLQQYAEDFVESCLAPRFFPELLQEIELQRKEGRLLILNTASPDIYVGAIAEKLGFDHFRATQFCNEERMPLLPRIRHLNREEGKIRSMLDLLPAEVARHCSNGSAQFPPKIANSHTYTDSSQDLPMIRLATDATLIGVPPPALRQLAHQEGWRILLPPNWKKGTFSPLLQIIGLYK